MEVDILAYIIVILIVTVLGAWWLYKTISSINANIKDLQTNKYSRLTFSLDNIRNAIDISKNELLSSNNSIKNQIASESNTIRQMMIAQLSSQTVKLVDDVEINRRTLSNLINLVQDFQNQTIKDIKDNTKKMGDFNNSIIYAISDLNNNVSHQIKDSTDRVISNEQQNNKSIIAGIDMVFRKISEYNKAIEEHLKLIEDIDERNTKHIESSITSIVSSLKIHKESITSACTQMLNTEKELHQKTKTSFDIMNGELSKYLMQLKQIESLYNNLQNLYTKILEGEKNILKQEDSLSTMVSKHSQIFEMTSEMNNTTKEIFEFMKLYLIQSTLDNFKE